MEFVEQARHILLPLIERVLELGGGSLIETHEQTAAETDTSGPFVLDGADESLPMRMFFSGIQSRIRTMQDEIEVLELFFEKSTSAFLGFQYSDSLAAAIDELLAAAEQIAFTMSASDSAPH